MVYTFLSYILDVYFTQLSFSTNVNIAMQEQYQNKMIVGYYLIFNYFTNDNF